jgi:stress-induced morphogen
MRPPKPSPCLLHADLMILNISDFAVEIVSSAFDGKVLSPSARSLELRIIELTTSFRQATLQRHRLIYAALDHELKNGVHALQLKTKTPAEVTDN